MLCCIMCKKDIFMALGLTLGLGLASSATGAQFVVEGGVQVVEGGVSVVVTI